MLDLEEAKTIAPGFFSQYMHQEDVAAADIGACKTNDIVRDAGLLRFLFRGDWDCVAAVDAMHDLFAPASCDVPYVLSVVETASTWTSSPCARLVLFEAPEDTVDIDSYRQVVLDMLECTKSMSCLAACRAVFQASPMQLVVSVLRRASQEVLATL